MKPWREVVEPHKDVLSSKFQQAEFAADISAMDNPDTPPLYRDARTFYRRTYITEGMRLLLTQVAERLNARGGEPVIQLQTAFGGGKTHTMLAVYHLARRECPLSELAGVSTLLDRAGLMDVPPARVAILDGTARAPNESVTRGGVELRTLWGHLAWQLGGEEGFELVRRSDVSGTSPGKEILRELLARYAPCVVLVDELVAYLRQFNNGQQLTGGTYNSNLSFVQALTEAVKLVPDAILLASLPEVDVEAGDIRGKTSLAALEKVFGRVQALWKPITAEEGFEIVRMRLFEPLRDTAARDAVCRAFARTYAEEGARLPPETHEARYFDRLARAYPIHPEVFERLYEEWTTLPGFQRTRGVLKLMARVIQRLWRDHHNDLMILPGSLPLYDSASLNELMCYLPPGWDAVLGRDIDGDGAEAVELDARETRFGAVQAARRVARTVFLASAPASGATTKVNRGVERSRVLLGCLQPGQGSSVYSDALDRLSDRLHYLNVSGERGSDTTRYWFDTRANLRREMEDRKARFDDDREVQPKIAAELVRMVSNRALFEGAHVFTPHGDVPDDGALRLVVLRSSQAYTRQASDTCFEGALEHLRNHGVKPRFRCNRLIFLAADASALGRLRDAVRTALAWGSIVADSSSGKLNVDVLQQKDARRQQEAAEAVVQRAARECFRWLVCPTMGAATVRDPEFEVFSLNTGSASFAAELDRLCSENELVIKAWSPIHLRDRLRELYWKEGRVSVRAQTVWEDMQKYLYLPRLQSREVFDACVRKGAAGTEFFGTACGESGGSFEGFRLGDGNVQVDGALLLIEPEAARVYQGTMSSQAEKLASSAEVAPAAGSPGLRKPQVPRGPGATAGPTSPQVLRSFYGSVDVNASAAKMGLVTLAEEIIALLASDPYAEVKVTVEISAEFPHGARDDIKRAVSENAAHLGFKNHTWE